MRLFSRRNVLAAFGCTLVLFSSVTLVSCRASKDDFGIKKLNEDRSGGMTWVSKWDSPREFDGFKDPGDSWFVMPGSDASYEVSNGELKISGVDPRMYIREPSVQRQWRDVEITMYFKRVSDEGTSYAGMTAVARTNHGVTGSLSDNLCDSRGVGGRLRYDGNADIEKETSYPHNDVAKATKVWSNGMPKNTWFGYKYVVYDLPTGSVKMEVWLDVTDGKNGGEWLKVIEVVDDGNLFGDESCAEGVDPQLQLTNATSRDGSESGKPNIAVAFRSDNVGEDGLVYKKGSVREISAP